MKQIIKKGSFLTFMFMLLGCLSLYAADNDLITEQITINLEKAGTLPDRIDASKKYLITNLKLVGEINGTDWKMIREMAGSNYKGEPTEGKLSVLDLSEAKIVKGGDCYLNNGYDYTSNDVIGDRAFLGCSVLTSLTLPAGITSIGDNAFWDCNGLKEVRFCINGNLDTYLTKGHPYIYVYSCGIKYYINDKEITSIEIPSNVTTLGDCDFQGCSGLTSLTLSAGITKIGDDAFNDCSGLKEVRFCINDNLDTYLTKGHPYIDVDCGIKYYINDKEITSIEIPSNVTTLGDCVFQGFSGLTSLDLPAGITEIGSSAFQDCSGLTSLTLPAGITKIGAGTFSGCSGLTSIYVYAEKVPRIDSYAFAGVDAKKCTLYVPMGTRDDYRLSVFGDYFENIVEFEATGIDKTTTSTDVEEVSRYSVNGQRLVGPTKGLNIVKYSDGSVKKVAAL